MTLLCPTVWYQRESTLGFRPSLTAARAAENDRQKRPAGLISAASDALSPAVSRRLPLCPGRWCAPTRTAARRRNFRRHGECPTRSHAAQHPDRGLLVAGWAVRFRAAAASRPAGSSGE